MVGDEIIVEQKQKVEDIMIDAIPKKKTIRNLIIFLVIMIIAVPLGLLASGSAYGEWGTEELKTMLGYAPPGIVQGDNIWGSLAPLADYGANFQNQNIGYWISAIVGVILIFIIIYVIGKVITKKQVKLEVSPNADT